MGVAASHPAPHYPDSGLALTRTNYPKLSLTVPREAEKFDAARPPSFIPANSSTMKMPDNASCLSREVLLDRIAGAIFGNCIGDAIGLATEFMDRETAKSKYGAQCRDLKVLLVLYVCTELNSSIQIL